MTLTKVTRSHYNDKINEIERQKLKLEKKEFIDPAEKTKERKIGQKIK